MIIRVDIVTVTPEMASELLKGNTRNRRVAERTVEAYARDMAAGAWHLNGEAIKVAEDGTLLDGQQRLQAIVKAGVPVEMLVVSDLPVKAQDTMDQGRRRTFSDQLTIDGTANATALAAIARRVFQWDVGNTRFATGQIPTAAELATVIRSHPGLHRSAEIGTRTAMAFRATSATVIGTTHHLFSRVDKDRTAEFFAQFETGANLGEGHPILALRNRLTRDKMTDRKVPFHLAVALFIRSWNGYVEGRSMDRLVQTAEDRMPEIQSPRS